jgi:hypothetical protein
LERAPNVDGIGAPLADWVIGNKPVSMRAHATQQGLFFAHAAKATRAAETGQDWRSGHLLERARLEGGPLHGIQTWAALPERDEETEPAFFSP